MRRALTTLAFVSVLFVAASALAKDDPPPPPPPPPPSDTKSDDDKKDEGSTSSGGDGSFFGGDTKSTGGLMDVSKGKKRPMMLSAFIGLTYGSFWPSGLSIPIGLRFNLPIIHDGFIPPINNSFDLEFGFDFGIAPFAYGFYSPFYILAVVEPRLTVYLLPKLAVYVKPLNLGIAIMPPNYYCGSYCTPIFFHYEFAIGATLELTKTWYLRVQLGSHSSRVGIGFAF